MPANNVGKTLRAMVIIQDRMFRKLRVGTEKLSLSESLALTILAEKENIATSDLAHEIGTRQGLGRKVAQTLLDKEFVAATPLEGAEGEEGEFTLKLTQKGTEEAAMIESGWAEWVESNRDIKDGLREMRAGITKLRNALPK